MEKFIFQVIKFVLIGVIIGEIIVRVFGLNIDVEKAYVDKKDNLIKYYPNQTGSSSFGYPDWVINQYGNHGPAPKSLDSLVTIIGDSYISSKNNPRECHQAVYLANLAGKFNYFPSSRAGIGFMEYIIMTKSLNQLNPLYHVLYVHHGDFVESIQELGRQPLQVQLSIKDQKITHAKLSSSKYKDFLYNFKIFYYLYRRFNKNVNVATNNRITLKKGNLNYQVINELMIYVKKNYKIDNIILVFSPDADQKVIDLASKNGFHTFTLTAENYKSWQFVDDPHWSCVGQEEAAKQVAKYLNSL